MAKCGKIKSARLYDEEPFIWNRFLKHLCSTFAMIAICDDNNNVCVTIFLASLAKVVRLKYNVWPKKNYILWISIDCEFNIIKFLLDIHIHRQLRKNYIYMMRWWLNDSVWMFVINLRVVFTSLEFDKDFFFSSSK